MKSNLLVVAIPLGMCIPQALADSTVGNVDVTAFAALTFTEDTRVNFGQIPPTAGNTCAMDNAGTVGAPCIDPGSTQTAGQITVSGLAASSSVLFTITGDDDDTDIDFTATADATDGTTSITINDGVQSGSGVFTTTAAAADIVFTVYGTIDVATALTASTAYVTTYTLDVSYE